MSKIYAFENRQALVSHMEKIAKREVKHYFTDFTDYDVKDVLSAEVNTSFIWMLRESGTYFMKADHFENIYAVLTNMRNTCAYVVTFGRVSDTIQKTDLEGLEKKYSRLAREAKEARERKALLDAA